MEKRTLMCFEQVTSEMIKAYGKNAPQILESNKIDYVFFSFYCMNDVAQHGLSDLHRKTVIIKLMKHPFPKYCSHCNVKREHRIFPIPCFCHIMACTSLFLSLFFPYPLLFIVLLYQLSIPTFHYCTIIWAHLTL